MSDAEPSSKDQPRECENCGRVHEDVNEYADCEGAVAVLCTDGTGCYSEVSADV